MNDKERDSAFKKERTQRRKAKTKIQRDTYSEIVRLLEQAEQDIQSTLKNMPSEYQAWYLPQVEQNIRLTMALFTMQGKSIISGAASKVWQAGIDLVDKPIAAGGINISAILPDIDPNQLVAMRSFMTGRIQDISEKIANRINAAMGMTAMGAQSVGDTISQVATYFEKDGRGRAQTIVRTELGRAFSVATQARMGQAKKHLPGLQKQWRRSGKIHSRLSHDGADGQEQDVDDFFIVGTARLMYPRDPQASISETINCGCDSLPHMKHWEMKNPRKQPITAQEKALDSNKRLLDAASRAKPITRQTPA